MGMLSRKKKNDFEVGEYGTDAVVDASEKCRWLRFGCGRLRVEINPVVTLASAAIIWGLVIWCMVKPEQANEKILPWMPWITKTWTWLYVGKILSCNC